MLSCHLNRKCGLIQVDPSTETASMETKCQSLRPFEKPRSCGHPDGQIRLAGRATCPAKI